MKKKIDIIENEVEMVLIEEKMKGKMREMVILNEGIIEKIDKEIEDILGKEKNESIVDIVKDVGEVGENMKKKEIL